MDKVALITLHTGFNSGTFLQAYAMNELIKECGYDPLMIWHKSSAIAGRDVTLSKLFIMFFRLVCHPYAYNKTIGAYVDNFNYDLSEETKKKFLDFSKKYFDIREYNYVTMHKIARRNDIKGVVCGSDQIWKSDALYISPYYYLRFAPKNKRIAYAPSFGRDDIPNYNKNILKKYISDFNFISVRETSGQNLVKKLTGRDCDVVLDPTLVVDTSVWEKFVKKENGERYILCYFLDEPSKETIQFIEEIMNCYKLQVKFLPYVFNSLVNNKNFLIESAGPEEFLNFIANASLVFTDSFHASVFSILFKIPFFTLERKHKHASSQNTRIENLLNIFNLRDRYIEDIELIKVDKILECNYEQAFLTLEKEKIKSMDYLKNAIRNIDNM